MCNMLYEEKIFENDLGVVVLYKETEKKFSIERRVARSQWPGIYRCKIYNCFSRDDDEKEFIKQQRILTAMLDKRQKSK